MNGLVTDNRLKRSVSFPLAMAQTALTAGKVITLASIPVNRGQRLELRSLSIGLLNVLTPDTIPAYLNTAMGLCSVGLYQETMLTSPLAYTFSYGNTTTVNPFTPCIITSPGVYAVLVSNNTSNVDLSVAVSGAIRLYS